MWADVFQGELTSPINVSFSAFTVKLHTRFYVNKTQVVVTFKIKATKLYCDLPQKAILWWGVNQSVFSYCKQTSCMMYTHTGWSGTTNSMDLAWGLNNAQV